MTLLGLLFIPFIVAGICAYFLHTSITWKEFLLQISIQIVVISSSYCIVHFRSLSDTEHINGRITAKNHGSQKCCHCRQVCDGYREVCRGSGKDRSCSSECTGYHEECDHSMDYWWSLGSTVGEISIDSCESNSRRVPAAWKAAYIGEPATVENSYINYLKADSNSLLVHKDFKKFTVPKFPEVYGYYHVNPVQGSANFPHEWQKEFREINADLGRSKQVDIKVLTTWFQDPIYAQAVESKWLYGPKNSVNIILGIQGENIAWARVVSFSKVEDLKVYLRDELQGKNIHDDIPGIVGAGVQEKFHRTPMANYEYLAKSFTVSTRALVILYCVGFLLSIGLTFWMHKKDVFRNL